MRDAVDLVHLDRGKVWWRLGWLVDREELVESEGGDGLDRLGGWLGAENKKSGGGDGLDGWKDGTGSLIPRVAHYIRWWVRLGANGTLRS